MKYTLQILPDYQAPKDVLGFIWHEMDSTWEPVFNFLFKAIWSLASVFNFLISAIAVVLFFTILTALKLVEFGINLVLFLCKGLWHGIKNIFESLSELYQSDLSPNKLSTSKGKNVHPLPYSGKPKPAASSKNHETMFNITLDRNGHKVKINERIAEIQDEFSNFLTAGNLMVTDHNHRKVKLKEIRRSIDSLFRTVQCDLSNAKTALSTQNIWKLANSMVSKINTRSENETYKHRYDTMSNSVLKSLSVKKYIQLVGLRVKNSGDCFAGQLRNCKLDNYTEDHTKVIYDEISIAIKAYIVISCLDLALDYAQERNLFDDFFKHSDDSSDSQSEHHPDGHEPDAPRYGGFFGQ